MGLKRGYIQVYTGNGKGKTTAALGLALRAAGAGLKVYIGQFIKKGGYSEIKALKKIKNIKIEQFGRGCRLLKKPNKIDTACAKKGLKAVRDIISKKNYDIAILDEVNIALRLNLVSLKDVMDILKNKPKNMEIILTGRGAPQKLLRLADLVTEMKEIRHYYNSGARARRGIEN